MAEHHDVSTERPASPPLPVRTSGGRDPVALVTGANHGIGAATCVALAARGARVVVTGLPATPPVTDDDPVVPAAYHEQRARDPEEVAAAIRAAGGEAVGVTRDLAEGATPAVLYDLAEERFGAPVRILVHNASGWLGDSFTGPDVDDLGRQVAPVTADGFDRQFAVDARAGALLIAEHARRHRQRDDDWGRIVSLTSGGPSGFPSEASYGAAKAALDNYVVTAAAELGHLGITANAVLPPVTDTGWVTDPVRAFVRGSRQHTHVVAPEEVAEVIAWLCSDEAWLVSGNRLTLR